MIEKADLVVIGSGPGGYVAAIRAAQLGKKVAIVEAKEIGGVCLNVGCIPSKALISVGHRYQESINSNFMGIDNLETKLNFEQFQKWKNKTVINTLTSGVEMLLKKNGVTIIRGHAKFESKNKLKIIKRNNETLYITFNSAIIATGSRPIEIPGFEFSKRILDSTGALNLSELPTSISIIGAGYIGCELASAYANLGVEVTLIESLNRILSNFEEDISNIVEKSLIDKGVKIITSATAKHTKENEEMVQTVINTAEGEVLNIADYLIVTVGRKPNTDTLNLGKIGVDLDEKGFIIVNSKYQSSLSHVYAIGDVIHGLALAHKATYDAKVAAEVITGKDVVRDYRCIPSICFTDPEISMVGVNQKEAKEKNLKVETSEFPIQANGRAITLNETSGFVRLVYLQDSKELVGAQIVGVNASEIIGELTMAIENYLTIEDISLIIHGHPTLSETIMDAAELGKGLPIHL
ncbi:dihydrolipoyl dehydrogenase [Vagococcus lutrae]|uniref:dihydrolipoyl dehydrogenase n=1 Tax=Vagococcus lutrae TaxID=81947 RepID=UPI001C95105E|nr:dihydrolipoyl dehydrogenase [Vagococcus lutrae]QZN88163.1 dihydrolipoyl dehydrogenase [Vagococcus lutrae]